MNRAMSRSQFFQDAAPYLDRHRCTFQAAYFALPCHKQSATIPYLLVFVSAEIPVTQTLRQPG